jgi:hypothetical protein
MDLGGTPGKSGAAPVFPQALSDRINSC